MFEANDLGQDKIMDWSALENPQSIYSLLGGTMQSGRKSKV